MNDSQTQGEGASKMEIKPELRQIVGSLPSNGTVDSSILNANASTNKLDTKSLPSDSAVDSSLQNNPGFAAYLTNKLKFIQRLAQSLTIDSAADVSFQDPGEGPQPRYDSQCDKKLKIKSEIKQIVQSFPPDSAADSSSLQNNPDFAAYLTNKLKSIQRLARSLTIDGAGADASFQDPYEGDIQGRQPSYDSQYDTKLKIKSEIKQIVQSSPPDNAVDSSSLQNNPDFTADLTNKLKYIKRLAQSLTVDSAADASFQDPDRRTIQGRQPSYDSQYDSKLKIKSEIKQIVQSFPSDSAVDSSLQNNPDFTADLTNKLKFIQRLARSLSIESAGADASFQDPDNHNVQYNPFGVVKMKSKSKLNLKRKVRSFPLDSGTDSSLQNNSDRRSFQGRRLSCNSDSAANVRIRTELKRLIVRSLSSMRVIDSSLTNTDKNNIQGQLQFMNDYRSNATSANYDSNDAGGNLNIEAELERIANSLETNSMPKSHHDKQHQHPPAVAINLLQPETPSDSDDAEGIVHSDFYQTSWERSIERMALFMENLCIGPEQNMWFDDDDDDDTASLTRRSSMTIDSNIGNSQSLADRIAALSVEDRMTILRVLEEMEVKPCSINGGSSSKDNGIDLDVSIGGLDAVVGPDAAVDTDAMNADADAEIITDVNANKMDDIADTKGDDDSTGAKCVNAVSVCDNDAGATNSAVVDAITTAAADDANARDIGQRAPKVRKWFSLRSKKRRVVSMQFASVPVVIVMDEETRGKKWK